MPRPECPPTENIIRAIHSAYWDEKHQRWSSTLFVGPGTSVARLSILGLAELLTIFHKELDSLEKNQVVKGAGEINIGYLQELGRQRNPPVAISVEEDPTDTNPAHAEIPQKLPRGLALEIIKKLTLHWEPVGP